MVVCDKSRILQSAVRSPQSAVRSPQSAVRSPHNVRFVALLLILFTYGNIWGQTSNPVGPQHLPIAGNWSGNSVFNPNAYIEANGIAGFERVLARSVDMADFITTLGEDWSPSCNAGTSFVDGVTKCQCGTKGCNCYYSPTDYIGGINMLTDINASYLLNTTGYYLYSGESVFIDSERYSASGFNISSLDRANNSYFIYKARKMVEDINKAYDSKKLRRPVIDAFIPEGINNSKQSWGIPPSNGTPTYHIEFVKIPETVISAFMTDMTLSEKSYYLTNNVPKTNLYFKFDNITFYNTYAGHGPDLSKIEARMWLYFVSKQFIDMGFTSLNYSQINMWIKTTNTDGTFGFKNISNAGLTQAQKEAATDASGVSLFYTTEVKAGYWALTQVCDKVRAYATSKNKLILLWNQSDRIYYAYDRSSTMPYTYTKRSVTDNGQTGFVYLFDWNNAAMRPLEVVPSTSVFFGQGRNIQPCNTPQLNEATFNTLMPACASNLCNSSNGNFSLKATIDPCSGTNYERNAAGFSPRPWATDPNGTSPVPNTAYPKGRYFDKQPTDIHWDGGSTVMIPNPAYADGPNNTDISHKCTPWTGTADQNWGTYNYDDSRWFNAFFELQGSACVNDWLKYQYTNTRKFDQSDHVYFLPMPGRIFKRYSPAHDLISEQIGGRSFFQLYEQDAIKEHIKKNIWNVNELGTVNTNGTTNGITLSLNPSGGTVSGSCSGYVFPTTCTGETKRGSYSFNVKNPDLSSIYTWHIKWSDNSWEPMTYGIARIFEPNKSGTFTVMLRQDNLGLPPTYYGSKTVSTTYTVGSTCVLPPPCGSVANTRQVANTNVEADLTVIATEDASKIFENVYSTHNISNNEKEIEKKEEKQGLLTKNTDSFTLEYYPQPTSQIVTIDMEIFNESNITIEAFDIIGKEILDKTNLTGIKGYYSHQVDMVNILPGTYLFKMTINNVSKTIKVIKI